MTGHLGGTAHEVHDEARAVIDFWFGLTEKQQFAKDAALDREIGERFGALRQQVFDTRAQGWRDDPQTMLAAIILLDQFSRNLYRGQAKAFEADDLALALTYDAIAQRWDRSLPPEQAVFLLMPLMHAEDAAAQAVSVEKFDALGRENNARFAHDHRAVFDRFGRFPSRNDALGRGSTEEELDYLSQPGAGW
ncbi:hypothetical protein ASE86_07270 [Sphingomonas sp. Leaf33]|uniref:DUF924 family protein n=1 Tax=Sphingomonas sp. Leaf33 TaxID=1736215 RepID=UPI0006F65D99|nr:DUF924 family protein [Sphingomonas sp. Leaf33]KQN25973.1 hypothetical protein ASE86_07270 [Sphingomonas sp. Leaf33]